jgi:HEPN domain-containing protein
VTQALGDEAFIREARAMPVFVHAPIEPEARSAFEDAAGDDQRVGGVVEDETTGDLEVYFELPASDVDRAFNEARGLYRRVVEAAGLAVPEPLELAISGFEALMVQASRDRELLSRAHELMERNEYDLTVIVAQTACEVLVADALRSLLHPHVSDQVRPWLLGRVTSFTLMDDPTRALWNQVTGSTVQDQSFWEPYKTHVKRRHAIVHSGERVDTGAAQSSLDAAVALFDYVEACIGSTPPPTSAS